MEQDLKTYYNERAMEYDKVYEIPAEQKDLQLASLYFQELFSKKNILEIACGTGYWTEQIAKTAKSIFATDINESVVNIAKTKRLSNVVELSVADMYTLNSLIKYEGIFGGFIWSHILLQDLDKFLQKISELVASNGKIAFIDSNSVKGTNHDKRRITRIDEFGNTFQTRQLDNGKIHEVLKNFPNSEFLNQKLKKIATDINFIELEHYWIISCNAK